MDRYNSSMIIVSLILLTGCITDSKQRKGHIIFIDYSKSALTFTSSNKTKVEEVIQGIIADMNSDDFIEVFPIHAFTMSATSVLRLQGPSLKGDLRDKKRREDWIENTVNAGVQKLWNIKISDQTRMSTDLYPIVNKVSRMVKNGYKPVVIIISDMIQDHNGESFINVFNESKKVVPTKYSKKKVSELGLTGLMKGIDVIIKIPGSPEGDMIYNEIRSSVDAFWEEFFTLCGAEVTIENL